MVTDDEKLKENLEYNRKRWGDRAQWEEVDSYGYNWSSMHETPQHYSATYTAETQLLPFLEGRRRIATLEIAPGAGRFTTELIRISSKLTLLDLNQACIDICQERFKYYSHIDYHTNDGISCAMVPDNTYDLIASYDSFVHIDPPIVYSYLEQFRSKLINNGLVWLHHSGYGEDSRGHRTAMTSDLMKKFAEELGYQIVAQQLFYIDCVSVLRWEQ